MLFRRKMVYRNGSSDLLQEKRLTRSCVLQGEVLIFELVPIDGLATSAVSGSEVTALAHEVRDDAMEGRSFESEPLLPSAESTEVLTGLGHDIRPQLHDDFSNGSTISSNIEENASSHCG